MLGNDKWYYIFIYFFRSDPMKFQTSYFSCPGSRENNEDWAAFSYKKHRSGVWAVADGLGGHLNGEIASRTAVDAAISAFMEKPKVSSDNIIKVMETANRAVWCGQGDEHGYDSMKTTLVAMFMRRGYACFAHAGDSRLYLFRKNRIVFQTRDHTMSQLMMENDKLPEGDVRFCEDRNQLLCALGAYNVVSADVTNKPIRLRRGDAVLMCTDGFWERVFEERMEDTLSISKSPEQWLSLMRFHHEREQTERQDNYTAMAVFVR